MKNKQEGVIIRKIQQRKSAFGFSIACLSGAGIIAAAIDGLRTLIIYLKIGAIPGDSYGFIAFLIMASVGTYRLGRWSLEPTGVLWERVDDKELKVVTQKEWDKYRIPPNTGGVDVREEPGGWTVDIS